MNHFADIDRDVIGERNEGLGREMRRLRPTRRPRKGGEAQPGLRLASLVSRSTLPLLRRAGLAD